MAGLNQRQVKYLQERIENIYKAKVISFLSKQRDYDKNLQEQSFLTKEDIVSCLKSHPELVVNPDYSDCIDTNAIRKILFKPYVSLNTSYCYFGNHYKLIDDPKTKIEPFLKEKQRALDEIFLGSAEEALQIIRDLESFEF